MAIRESGSEPSSSQFAELPTSQYQNKQPQQEINQAQGRRCLCGSQRILAGGCFTPWSLLVTSDHLWSSLVTLTTLEHFTGPALTPQDSLPPICPTAQAGHGY